MKSEFIYENSLPYFKVLMLMILLGSFSCNKDKDKLKDQSGSETVAKIDVDDSDLSVANTSGKQTLSVTSNVPWTASTDVLWMTINTTKGEKGTNNLVFTVDENDGEKRSGTITIYPTKGKTSTEVNVTQKKGPPDKPVNKNNFYVKSGGDGDGSSWNKASTLDYALSNSIGGSKIHLAAGTYTPSIAITNGDLSNPSDVTFEINKNITLIGGYPSNVSDTAVLPNPSADTTILSGKLSNDEAYHVVTISAPKEGEGKVVLSGITITGGNASGTTSTIELNGTTFLRHDGGGMIIGNANVEINSCEIIDNKSQFASAGLFIVGGATVTIKNSKIDNNIANKNLNTANGAGMWAYESDVTIYNSEINGNEGGGVGPGIYGYPSSTITLYNSTVANNKGASYGAAVYIREKSKAILVNSLIYGNESTSTYGGGGLMMYDNCVADVISTTITKNNIAGPGGGVYRQKNTNELNIYNSIISGNVQKSGSSDVDDNNQPAPKIISSVIGAKAYDGSGSEITGSTFDASTMLNNSFLPIGNNDPAVTYGMDASALSTLGNSYTPKLEDYVNSDMNSNSRSGLNIMGPLVE